jgi:hypothetical protein
MSTLAVVFVGVVVVAGLALYLRAGPRPGAEPSLSPPDSTTAGPTDSAAPTESPIVSPALTASAEPTSSPAAGSLEEYLANIAVPVLAEIDGKYEWVVARDGSMERLGLADDVTRALYRSGLLILVQPRGEGLSTVRVLDSSGRELASVEVPLGERRVDGFVTRDRRLAYVMDDRSILRVHLDTGVFETLHEGPPVLRDESDLSPSGNTLATLVCSSEERCDTHLVTGDPGVVLEEFYLLGANDEYIVGFESLSARQWLVYSIEDRTRREIPVPEIRIAWDGYALDDGRFVITGSDDEGWSMWIFDPVADTVTPIVLKDIAPTNIVVYDRFMPSTRWAVVGPTDGVSLGGTLHVVDLETGHTVAEVKLGQ